MHRFFVTEQDFIDGKEAIVRTPAIVRQWKTVLRFKEGERVVLLRGDGEEHEMIIRDMSGPDVRLALVERRFSAQELPVRLVLAQSFLKHVDKFELVLQKVTELGVAAFIPVLSDRTEKRMEPKRDRWSKIMLEAAEQSGRAIIPELHDPESLTQVIKSHAYVIVPHPAGDKKLEDILIAGALPSEIVCCIGPEGGFTDAEISAARAAGAHIVSLGKRTLRAETAGIVSVAFIANLVENLN
jgi:16S rRNA (uracil1498-N3)-methyltransferase